MIRDVAAYRRLREREERDALQALDLAASIGAAEASLMSSIVRGRAGSATPRPFALARAVGIPPARIRRATSR